MHRRIFVAGMLAAVVAGALAAGGCATPSTSGTSQKSAATTKTVEVSNADAGSTVALHIGDTLTVNLPGNPSTGYTWSPDGPLPPFLKEEGQASFEASSSAIGSGGTMTMRYLAATTGDGELSLKYWRTFEPTVPPVATFKLTLKVR